MIRVARYLSAAESEMVWQPYGCADYLLEMGMALVRGSETRGAPPVLLLAPRRQTYSFAPSWLPGRWGHPIVGYLGAALAAIVSVLFTTALDWRFPHLAFPAAPSLAAVVGVSLSWGLLPGLVAVLLSLLLLNFYVLSPQLAWSMHGATDVASTAVFLGTGIIISAVAGQAESRRRQVAVEQAQLTAMLDILPEPLTVWDRGGTVVRVNEALERQFGRPRVGTTLPRLGHEIPLRTLDGAPIRPEDFPIARALRGEPVQPIEVRSGPPLGPDRYVEILAATLRDTEGAVRGAIALTHDLTPLREAEQTASRRAAELQAIFDTMTDGVAVYDQDGRILHMNAAMQQLFGFDQPHPLAGQSAHRRLVNWTMRDESGHLLASEHWPITRLLAGEMLAGARSMNIRVQSLDGRELILNTSGAPLRDGAGQVVGAVCVQRDITELRELERAVQAERDRLQQVLDLLPEAVQMVDAEGRFLISNRAAAAILGRDLVGQQLGGGLEPYGAYGMRRIDGSPLQAEDSPLQRALRQGEERHGEQILFRNAIGEYDVPVLMNAAPLRDPAGHIVGAVAVYQNITALKTLDRQREEFLATVSHDLKNPLTSIVMMTQLFRRRIERLAEPGLASVADGLRTVTETAQRMTVQIDELLEVNRVLIDQPPELRRRPLDLVALVAHLVEEHRLTSERHIFRFIAEVDHLTASVDGRRLERALANVLGNALKYSPDGGLIEVTIRCTEDRNGTWATIRIEDEGLGIPEIELPRVFDRFYRAGNVAEQVRGTGLGLAGARQVVEQHGGSIGITSVEGRGTTITMLLPVAPPDGDVPAT